MINNLHIVLVLLFKVIYYNYDIYKKIKEKLKYNNKKLTISAWAKEMKISPMTIRAKMANGYSFTFLCDQYFNHKD